MTSDQGPEAEFREFDKKNKWNEIYHKMRIKAMNNDHSLNDCKLPQNRGRNRYRDVYPYDHSRVRLQRDDIDYINANLVEAPRAKRKYILTQGPMSSTCGHLWLMVWEQRSRAVVMLNRLMEGLRGPLGETCGHFWLMAWEQRSKAVLMLNKIIEKGTTKCHRYYPLGEENGAEKELEFPEERLSVQYVREDDCQEYTVRTLRLHDLNSGESREVLQFHYTSWPDFDVPSSPSTFLDYLQAVRDSGSLDPDVGPPVIHCSAGIGRSGTFCLVDTCLVLIEQAQEIQSLRVLDILLDMRQYRMGLIQTPDQLRFSYLAILEGASRVLPDLCATPDSGYQERSSTRSSSNGLLDSFRDDANSESNDSDIPSDPPPPPPRPDSTKSHRVRPQTANAARGRTQHSERYAPFPEVVRSTAAAAAATSDTVSANQIQEELGEEQRGVQAGQDFTPEDTNRLLQRGVEIRRRKREERQKNTQDQLARMRARQQDAELWRKRRVKLKPYLYGLAAVLVLGGAWLYKRYYT